MRLLLLAFLTTSCQNKCQSTALISSSKPRLLLRITARKAKSMVIRFPVLEQHFSSGQIRTGDETWTYEALDKKGVWVGFEKHGKCVRAEPFTTFH